MKIESIKGAERPYISIDAEALLKFYHILHSKYEKEFTVFTHAEKLGREYRIYDIFVPKQVNTPVHTEIDGVDLVEMLTDGADISKLNGHIHSHVNMDTKPSGTDEREILSRAELAGFNAALIINKKEEMFGHIADMELGFYMSDVDIYINYPHSQNTYDSEMLKSIKKLTSLDDVRTLLRFTEWDFYNTKNPLTDDVKEQLDGYIKDRFKNPFLTSNYGNNYNNKFPATAYKKKENDDWLSEVEEYVIDDEYDIPQYGYLQSDLLDREIDNMEDNEYFNYLDSKPVAQLTDYEWTWMMTYTGELDDIIVT